MAKSGSGFCTGGGDAVSHMTVDDSSGNDLTGTIGVCSGSGGPVTFGATGALQGDSSESLEVHCVGRISYQPW